MAPKGLLQRKRCQRFRHTQRNCRYCRYLSGGCSTPREQPQCCGCGGKYTANYRGCVKWKEARAALAKQAPERAHKNAPTGHPAPPKTQQAGPSAEQADLGEEWNHVIRGGHVVKATTPPPNSNRKPTPQPVTEVPRQPKVTATRKTARPMKPEHKSTAATKPAAGKSKMKAAVSLKNRNR